MRIRELAMLAAFAACGGGDDDGGGGDAAPEAPDACAAPAGEAAIVYLNRAGGTFAPGPEDAAANTTGLTEEERTVPPHPFDNGDAIVACFTAGLAPFHIDVVEDDPGDVDHHEVVFTGDGWFGEGVGSVSSFSCAGHPSAIAFVFGDVFTEDDAESQCHIALNQLGVMAAGLEHVGPREDFMSQAPFGDKSWVDDDLACGEPKQAMECQCGGDTQNSYQKMVATFGAACL